MKNILKSAVVLCTMSTMILSACGAKSEPNVSSVAPQNSTAAQGKVIKLKWWGGTPEENGPKAVVDKWNAANKDVQVEYVRFVNDDPGNTKLDTALLSSTDAPDVFFNYGDFLLDKRIKAGMLEPLDDLIKKSGFNVDEVIGLENIRKYENKIYYLPGNKDIRYVAFNKSALDAIGAKVPGADWTWDDYAALSKKLTKPGQYGTFFAPTWEPIALDVLISAQQKDAYYDSTGASNFNHPAFKKGLELQKDLFDSKAVMPYAEGIANKATPQDEFLKGKSASTFTMTYFLRYVKDDKAYPNRDFKVAFAPMPQYEKGRNVNNANLGDTLAINSKGANKEVAMKFLQWYLTEGNLEMIPGGRIPSNKKADINQIAERIIGDKGQYFDKESFVNMLKGQYSWVVTTKTTAGAEIRKAFMEEAEKYFMNIQPVDKTVEQIKKRSDEAINKASK